jgi:hypothetical protein
MHFQLVSKKKRARVTNVSCQEENNSMPVKYPESIASPVKYSESIASPAKNQNEVKDKPTPKRSRPI